jgi:large subunit ribosomal protein L18
MEKASKNKLRIHRKKRIKAKIKGTAQKPRLCVFKSLRGMYVQVIDDTKGVTLTQADFKTAKAKNDLIGAKKIGETIAKKCKEIKISKVVFDRAGYKYHGKVKALADGAREGGLKF